MPREELLVDAADENFPPTSVLDNNLSPKILYDLLECKNLDNLPKILGEKNAATQQRLQLRQRQRKKSSPLAHALFTTLTDATTSYPLYTLWMIIGCISLGLVPLSIITGGVALLTFVMAGALFYDSYRKHLKVNRQRQRAEILATIQLEAAEKIIARSPRSLNLEPDPPHPGTPRITTTKTVKYFLNTLILTATTLVGTYYLSAVAIALALGLATTAAALTGPIGIGIACGLALMLGGYFAYKQYQSNKQRKKDKAELAHLERKLEIRSDACATIKNELLNKNVRPLRIAPHFKKNSPRAHERKSLYAREKNLGEDKRHHRLKNPNRLFPQPHPAKHSLLKTLAKLAHR